MRFILIVALCSLLLSCYYNETYYGDVVVRESVKYKYEIQIRKHIEGRGNIHTLSFTKFEHDTSDWLYVDTLNGTIEVQDLTFTLYWACLAYPWSSQKLKGHIEFKEGKLVIALEGPWYEDGKTLSGYRPLAANGTYSIRFEKQPYVPADYEVNGAPCERTGFSVPQQQ